eukprot:6491952-Amphidinium_carterae.1
MRRGAFGRTWREGPGAVIATQGGTAWIAVQGDLYKCSNLSLKRAIGEEQLGIEAVRARIPDLQMQLRSKRRRGWPTKREKKETIAASSIEVPTGSVGESDPSDPSAPTSDEPARRRRRLSPRVAEAVHRIAGDPPAVEEVERPEIAEIESDSLIEYGPMRDAVSDVRHTEYWCGFVDDSCEQKQRCTIGSDELVAGLDHHQGVYMVTRRSSDEVDPSTLTEDEWKQFQPALESECANMIKVNQGLEPLSVEKSAKMMQKYPDRVIESRFHFRWKPVDDAKGIHCKPKVRLILRGFQDPDVRELPSSVPAPSMASIQAVLAVIASYRWEAFQSDFTQAFLQGKPVQRLLLVRQPAQGVPGLKPQQLLLLKKEVYGSIAGPSQWRLSVTAEIKKTGWQMTSADPCVFIMKENTKPLPTGGIESATVLQEENVGDGTSIRNGSGCVNVELHRRFSPICG